MSVILKRVGLSVYLFVNPLMEDAGFLMVIVVMVMVVL